MLRGGSGTRTRSKNTRKHGTTKNTPLLIEQLVQIKLPVQLNKKCSCLVQLKLSHLMHTLQTQMTKRQKSDLNLNRQATMSSQTGRPSARNQQTSRCTWQKWLAAY